MKSIRRKQNTKEQNNERLEEIEKQLQTYNNEIHALPMGDELRVAKELKAKKLVAERARLEKANTKITGDIKLEDKLNEETDAELTDKEKYGYFLGVKMLLSDHKFGLLRSGAKFFELMNYVEYDKKRGMKKYRKEIEYFSRGDLGCAFLELKSGYSLKLFREALEGIPIKALNPETESWEVFQQEKSVYYRFVNTLCVADKNTMNLIDLSEVMKPNKVDEPKLNWIFSCLFDAMGGQKAENKDWLLKWVYAVVYANIGDPLMTFPVIFGEGKIGRNALFDMIIPTILGRSLCQTGTWDTMDSNFNQFKLGKVFTFIDELPDRADWNKIKNQSGSLSSYVKTKYGPEFEIDNCIISAYGGNSKTYPLPMEDGRQMSRVSPVCSDGKTFAQLVYERGTELYGVGFMEAEYKRITNKDAPTTGDYMFEIGDKYLRNTQWATKDKIQDFLDYLHATYSPDGPDWQPDNDIKFILNPLRGKDWADIREQKKDPAVAVIEYLIKANPDFILTKVAYAMYEIAFKQRYGNHANKKSEISFGMTLANILNNTIDETNALGETIQPEQRYLKKRPMVVHADAEKQDYVWFHKDYAGSTTKVDSNRHEYIVDTATNGRTEPALKFELSNDDTDTEEVAVTIDKVETPIAKSDQNIIDFINRNKKY